VDTFTTHVELGVGVACVALGVTVARTRATSPARILGILVALAGAVAVVHAVVALFWSDPD
jgi:hypothetical protein